jgi:hypothetical protein
MIFAAWLMIVVGTITVSECINCYFPRIEDHYDSEGFMCSWEVDDFNYSEEDGYTLKEFDSTDNCFEAKFRKLKN